MPRNTRKTREGVFVKRVIIEIPEDIMSLTKIFAKLENKSVSRLIARFLEEYVISRFEVLKSKLVNVPQDEIEMFYKEHDDILSLIKKIEEKRADGLRRTNGQ